MLISCLFALQVLVRWRVISPAHKADFSYKVLQLLSVYIFNQLDSQLFDCNGFPIQHSPKD